MSLEEFQRRLRTACRRNRLSEPEVMEQIGNAIKFTVSVGEALQIRIYYNSATGTINSALVAGNKRIFGINGYPEKGVWHKHPFEEPRKHVLIAPLTLEEVLTLLAKASRRVRRR